MPYITQQDRKILKIDDFQYLKNGGELNYAITTLCARYIEQNGLRYKNISDVVGALEGAKMEFFRKVVNPYEQIKEDENGAIYE